MSLIPTAGLLLSSEAVPLHGKNKLKKFEDLRNWAMCLSFRSKGPGGLSVSSKAIGVQVFWQRSSVGFRAGLRQRRVRWAGRWWPDMNFIGIDIKGARMWTGARQAKEEALGNVAFLRTHIELLNSFFAPGEVAEIWLTFPDPQMKKVRKRLTSTYFMRMYQQVLAANAVLHLKTDSRFMYEYSLAVLKANALPIHYQTQNLYSESLPVPDIQTFYEQQWLLRGISIKYLRWSIPPVTNWKEPEVDIEPDEYRSFGRSARILPKDKQL